MEHQGLKNQLDNLLLVEDEKKMWMAIGFYIPLPKNITTALAYVDMINTDGYPRPITSTVAEDIRAAIIEWWQVERIKPRDQQPLSNVGYDELEVQRDG